MHFQDDPRPPKKIRTQAIKTCKAMSPLPGFVCVCQHREVDFET